MYFCRQQMILNSLVDVSPKLPSLELPSALEMMHLLKRSILNIKAHTINFMVHIFELSLF